jgi:hypothetical protein
MNLPLNCSNCEHFDGEHWCTLLAKYALIPGYIAAPLQVVCAKHEAKEAK